MEKNELLIKMVLTHEGFFVNDKLDNGKMTYCGISRRAHPDWEGWKIVDAHLPLKYNQKIESEELDNMVLNLYMKLYYIPMKIASINSLMLSAHVFCHGVNAGSSTAIKLLQKAINSVYKAQIAVDGKIGTQTLSYANKESKMNTLIAEYIDRRNEFYQNIVKRNPSQKKFLKGWLSRVKGTTQTVNNFLTINNKKEENVLYANGNVIMNQSIIQRIFNFLLKLFMKK